MDAARLNLSIPLYRLSPSGLTTFLYDIEIIYGKLKWVVSHRFSDFITLYSALISEGYDAVAPPPPKTLIRPSDSTSLDGRRVLLQKWLWSLCRRADLRQSAAFLEFIEFELQTNTVVTTSLLPTCVGLAKHACFRASDCIYIPSIQQSNLGSLFVGFEENVHISRLGKVWGVVDFEDLGAISLYKLEAEKSQMGQPEVSQIRNSSPSQIDNYPISLNLNANLNSPHRISAIYFHAGTGRLFCGTDSGVLKVFHLIQSPQYCGPSTNTADAPRQTTEGSIDFYRKFFDERSSGISPGSLPLAFVHMMDIPLHQEAIHCLRGATANEHAGASRLLTLGGDNAIRIIDCATLKTICGGRIQKRLKGSERLTIGLLEYPASTLATETSDQATLVENPLPHDSANLEATSHNSYRSLKDQHYSLNESMEDSSGLNEETDLNAARIVRTRLILGSSEGTLFIYNCGTHPPRFLSSTTLKDEIKALELAGSTCLVAHGYHVSILKLAKNPLLGTVTLQNTLSLPVLGPKFGNVRSIAVSQVSPLMFFGHARSISVWNCLTMQCVSVFKAHNGGIKKMQWFVTPNEDFILVSVSSDGYVKLWSIPDYQAYTPWSPLQDQVDEPIKEALNSRQSEDDDDDEPLLGHSISAVPHRH